MTKSATKKIILASAIITIAASLSSCGRKGDLEAPAASVINSPAQTNLA